jgi:hypothetical protein
MLLQAPSEEGTEQRRLSSHDGNRGLSGGFFCKDLLHQTAARLAVIQQAILMLNNHI